MFFRLLTCSGPTWSHRFPKRRVRVGPAAGLLYRQVIRRFPLDPPPMVRRALVFLVLTLTTEWLFYPPLVRSGIHVQLLTPYMTLLGVAIPSDL